MGLFVYPRDTSLLCSEAVEILTGAAPLGDLPVLLVMMAEAVDGAAPNQMPILGEPTLMDGEGAEITARVTSWTAKLHSVYLLALPQPPDFVFDSLIVVGKVFPIAGNPDVIKGLNWVFVPIIIHSLSET